MSAADFGSYRRSIYILLITIAAAAAAGRILAVQRLSDPGVSKPPNASTEPADADPPDPEDLKAEDHRGDWPKDRPRPMPTLGDNDRSRWATIRALVDDNTYVIGHQEIDAETGKELNSGIVAKDGWKTIDKVRHPESHDFYSSKPPLLPTLLAGEYWVMHALGLSIVTDRWLVVRTLLFTINWLPWVIYLWLLSRLVDRFGETEWARLFVLAAACFGTLVTPFLITLNNHTIAAFSALFALYPLLGSEPVKGGTTNGPLTKSQALFAGFFAAFTACNELPAAIFAVALLLWSITRSPRNTLLFFLPAAAVPVAAFLLTNWLAFHEFSPVYEKFGTEWYEYPGSHWIPEPSKQWGIDWASLKEGKAIYALHVLVGHHGLFSLTPVFLLAAAGMLGSTVGLARVLRNNVGAGSNNLGSLLGRASPLLVVGTTALIVTLIVVGFYIFGVDDRSRNYGGWACGARWLIWLTPLLLLSMLPVCDWIAGRRWGRGMGYALLGVSVLSASYPAWNPWRHPWIYNLLDSLGRIPY